MFESLSAQMTAVKRGKINSIFRLDTRFQELELREGLRGLNSIYANPGTEVPIDEQYTPFPMHNRGVQTPQNM